ncbi:prophage regulatory protein [Robbsia andropogonis]|uniref:helix-turn-helix transcriptional regulator n=1 Tax=Robbsia andropogonis TaxID=28092 RepID=UPI00209DC2F3|nr:AlpA family phage regulatory protein [Robbsia andropogonis]MCP1116914.1 AlpA family phage regulatory protein [Robbsia andropogonis]MCP1126407.1 AlpA family phage regulatory protein [Robbsia andropogonis]
MKVLRMKDLPEKVGLGKTTIYRMIEENQFPRPFPLTERGGPSGPVGWLESDVNTWIDDRYKATHRIEH